MLEHIKKLIQTLDAESVDYCHWKSNWALTRALEGYDDLDLLVRKEHFTKFEKVVLEMGFKRTRPPASSFQPSIEHFFGHDEKSGKLVHLHVYYELISGEHLFKNYRLPFENLIFDHLIQDQEMPVPERQLELEIFLIRIFLKMGTLMEQLLFWKEKKTIRKELIFLSSQPDAVESRSLIFGEVPGLDRDFFKVCIRALEEEGALRWFVLGRQMRKLIKKYRLFAPSRVALAKYAELCRQVRARLGSRKRKILSQRGTLVAITGPDATGKSTLSSQTYDWLKGSFTVRRIHVGKPPPGFLNLLPTFSLPFFRRIFSKSRTSVLNKSNGSQNKVGLLQAIRLVLLARDRKRLLSKASRWTSNGAIVICDRYPSLTFGAMDSPRIFNNNQSVKSFFIRKLALIEQNLYKTMPKADVLFQLSVDVEVAIQRNRDRIKAGNESEEYIRMRHEENAELDYPCHRSYLIHTNRGQTETLHEVKSILWQNL